MVIPFLVSARALSHGVQLVQRYNDELDSSETGSEAARKTFEGSIPSRITRCGFRRDRDFPDLSRVDTD